MEKNRNRRREMFVREYLVDLNAKQAAIRAGYSPKTADRIGPRLLKDADVGGAVEAALAERRERLHISAERVLEELARIAFADPRDVAEWGPDGLRLRDSADLSGADAASVSEVISTRSGTRLRRHDKVKALELLGRHLGMFTDRIRQEVSGPDGSPVQAQHCILVKFVGAGKEPASPEDEGGKPCGKLEGSL